MKKIIFIFFIFTANMLFAQEYFYSLEKNIDNRVNQQIALADTFAHTSFKPLRYSYVKELTGKDSLFFSQKRENFASSMPAKWFWKKLIAEDFITVKDKNLTFVLNPLLNYSKTNAKDDTTRYWQNTRGFEIHGTLGKKLSFYTDFFENQAMLLPYVDEKANYTLVVPGQAVWKPFEKVAKDYNYASGYLVFAPNDNLSFLFGRTKLFIGNGYRSVLLSDNGVDYPLFSVSYTKKKFSYNVSYAQLQDFETKFYFYHYRKHASFLFLNYAPFKNTEIGFFEGIIWRTSDDSTYVNHFPVWFFVPVPGVRELRYGLDDKNNILIGLNAKTVFFKNIALYGQFALDKLGKTDFDTRFAYQTGVKVYDLTKGLDNLNLYLQAEYNYAKPYTYTSFDAHSAYENFGEPLANTLGSGFEEFLTIAAVDFWNFRISYKMNKILTSTDTVSSNFGTDLLLSNTSHTLTEGEIFPGSGNATNILYQTFSAAYIINPQTHLQIFVEAGKRNFSTEVNENELFFISFGIKNAIKNFYTDF